MVLQKIEHVLADVVSALPCLRDCRRRRVTTDYPPERIVESHFVIEEIKASVRNITTVFLRIIHLCNELHLRRLRFHLSNCIMPELYRHHLRHVTAESVDALFHPIEQNGRHLLPRVGNRIEMARSSSHIVHSIIEFHRFIPVIATGPSVEKIISGSFRRHFQVGIAGSRGRDEVIGMQGLPPAIIEIIAYRKGHFAVIVSSQIPLTLRCNIRCILTCHVIRHKIKYEFESGLVHTANQSLELVHSMRHRLCQIRVDIKIIFDGVRRPSLSLDHPRMINSDPLCRIIGLRGMFNHPREPHVRETEFSDSIQAFVREVIEFGTTVFGICSVGDIIMLRVAIEAGKNLVDIHGDQPEKVRRKVGNSPYYPASNLPFRCFVFTYWCHSP